MSQDEALSVVVASAINVTWHHHTPFINDSFITRRGMIIDEVIGLALFASNVMQHCGGKNYWNNVFHFISKAPVQAWKPSLPHPKCSLN